MQISKNSMEGTLKQVVSFILFMVVIIMNKSYSYAGFSVGGASVAHKPANIRQFDLAKLFKIELLKTYEIKDEKVLVSVLASYPKDLAFYNPTFLPSARLPLHGGVVTIMTTYTDYKGKSQRGAVTFRIQKLENVFVTTTAVKVGDDISDKIAIEQRESITLPQDKIIDAGSLEGKIARIFIPKGVVISQRMVEDPILIKRGDPVTITIESDQIIVTTTGEALMDGQMDKIIRVKNLESQKIISAKVKDKGRVIVELP